MLEHDVDEDGDDSGGEIISIMSMLGRAGLVVWWCSPSATGKAWKLKSNESTRSTFLPWLLAKGQIAKQTKHVGFWCLLQLATYNLPKNDNRKVESISEIQTAKPSLQLVRVCSWLRHPISAIVFQATNADNRQR